MERQATPSIRGGQSNAAEIGDGPPDTSDTKSTASDIPMIPERGKSFGSSQSCPTVTAEKGSRAMTTMTDLTGFLASTMVLLTFMAKDMRLLRVLGISSNIAFITYGVLAWLPPVLCLHLLLLPVNTFRLYSLMAEEGCRLPAPRLSTVTKLLGAIPGALHQSPDWTSRLLQQSHQLPEPGSSSSIQSPRRSRNASSASTYLRSVGSKAAFASFRGQPV